MNKYSKICINCPAGCHLEIVCDGGDFQVSGNRCPRGITYARQELTDPRRVVTAVVFSEGTPRRCIPVKTTAPVPLAMIDPLLENLFTIHLKLPVTIGDIVIKNWNSTGIDVVTTGSCS